MRTVCTIFLFLLSCTASAQGTQQWASVGNWDVLIDPNLGDGCFVTRLYDDRSALRLGFDGDTGVAYLILYDYKWESLQVGKEYRIEIEFDHQGKWEATATGYALGDGLVGLAANTSKPEFLTEFMERWNLKLFYQGNEILRLPLSGSHKAVQEMAACQEATMNAREQGSKGNNDPFATEPEDPFRDKGPSTRDRATDPFADTVSRHSLEIGGRNVLVRLPGDHCQLKSSRPADKRILDSYRNALPNRRLFGAYTPCDTLEKWHNGQLLTLPRYSIVATVQDFVDTDIAMARKEVLSSIANEYDNATVTAAADKAVKAFNSSEAPGSVSDMRILGILARNDDALFVGALETVRTEFGDRKDLVSVIAITVVSNRIVYMTHARSFEGKDDLDEALSFSQEWLRLTVRANAAL